MDLVEEEHASTHVDVEGGGADRPEIPPMLEPGLCCSVSPARGCHPGAFASAGPNCCGARGRRSRCREAAARRVEPRLRPRAA